MLEIEAQQLALERSVASDGRIALQLLDELDRHERGRANPQTAAEQRHFARHRFRTSCTLRCFGEDGQKIETVPARSRNISRGGIGLLVRRWFRRGDAIHVMVTLPGASPSEYPGKIAFSRQVRGAWFEIGIKFVARREDDPLAPKPAEPEASDETKAEKTSNVESRGPRSIRESKLNMLSVARLAARHSYDARVTVKQLAESSDVVIRTKAMEALADVGGPEAIGLLSQALEDENADVRLAAVTTLEMLGPKPVAAKLQKCVTDDSIEIRLRASAALGRIGDHSGLPVVSKFLHDGGRYAPLAAVAFGAIAGQKFRPNSEGVAEARRYFKIWKQDHSSTS